MLVSKVKKGFTLLELVVVVVVIGILSSIAIPTYAAVIDRANEKSAVTSALAVLNEANILAAFESKVGTSVITTKEITLALADLKPGSATYTQSLTVPTTYTVDAGQSKVVTVDFIAETVTTP